ncbi:hypothetical protein HMPREF0208_03651 [Citrobacter koseri]|nr:hypothetical protein HMPREF3220_02679 [Citrobacter koseri]KXB41503.1 hypothetical protein HMPREF0208_03651 [Citrobacter koseri]
MAADALSGLLIVMLLVGPVSAAPPGVVPDGGWRLIRPTYCDASCRPGKRSVTGRF